MRRLIGFYDRTLSYVIEHRTLALMAFFATIVLTVVLYIETPKGYFPQDDTGLIFGGTVRPRPTFPIEAMEQLQQKAMDIVLADPGRIGARLRRSAPPAFNASVNRGRLFISLKPLAAARQRHHPGRHRAAARETDQHPRHPRVS